MDTAKKPNSLFTMIQNLIMLVFALLIYFLMPVGIWLFALTLSRMVIHPNWQSGLVQWVGVTAGGSLLLAVLAAIFEYLNQKNDRVQQQQAAKLTSVLLSQVPPDDQTHTPLVPFWDLLKHHLTVAALATPLLLMTSFLPIVCFDVLMERQLTRNRWLAMIWISFWGIFMLLAPLVAYQFVVRVVRRLYHLPQPLSSTDKLRLVTTTSVSVETETPLASSSIFDIKSSFLSMLLMIGLFVIPQLGVIGLVAVFQLPPQVAVILMPLAFGVTILGGGYYLWRMLKNPFAAFERELQVQADAGSAEAQATLQRKQGSEQSVEHTVNNLMMTRLFKFFGGFAIGFVVLAVVLNLLSLSIPIDKATREAIFVVYMVGFIVILFLRMDKVDLSVLNNNPMVQKLKIVEEHLLNGDEKALQLAEQVYKEYPNNQTVLMYATTLHIFDELETAENLLRNQMGQLGIEREMLARDKRDLNTMNLGLVMLDLVGVLISARKFTEAEEILSQLQILNPKLARIYSARAEILLLQKQSPELALDYLAKRALYQRKETTFNEGLSWRFYQTGQAWTYAFLGNLEESERWLQQANEKLADEKIVVQAEQLYYVGLVYLAQKRPALAIAAFEKSLELDQRCVSARLVRDILAKLEVSA